MDHLGSSSSGSQYAQSEPFFDLLHPSTTSGYSGVHNSLPVHFSNDDVLPGLEPIADTAVGKGKVDDAKRGWQSQAANSRNPAPASYELNVRPDKDAVETATVAAVERTMKKYADNLLRVLEGMSGRLTQLESNSLRMEHSVDKIKVEAADNFGATDGKLRSLENMIREVQRSVQVLRDKQEIAEEQAKLEKLQLSAKRENPSPVASTPIIEAIEAPLALPPPASAVKSVEAVPATQSAPLLQQQPPQLQHPVHQLPLPPQQVQQQPQHPVQQQPQHPVQQQQHQLQGQLPSQIQQLQMQGLLPLQHQQQLQMQGPPTHPQHQQLQGQVQGQGQNPPLPLPQPQMQGMHPPPQHHQQQLQIEGPPPQASHVPPQQTSQPQVPQQAPHLQQHQQLQLQGPTVNQPQPQYQPQQAPPAQHSTQMPPFYAQQQQQGQPGPAGGQAMAQHYGALNQEVNPYGASQGSYNQELPPPQVPPQVPGGYELRFLPLPPPSPSMGPMQQQLPTSQHQQLGQGGPPGLPGPYHPQAQAQAQAHPPQAQGRDAAPHAYNQYGPPQYRMAQPVGPAPGGQIGGYPQLPTARPVGSSMGSQGGGGGAPVAANRVPVDEVIDKVAGMGFGRDQVRAVVRKLTENGTSVDLNVVLDKLMNGGSGGGYEVQQPAKGWYGR